MGQEIVYEALYYPHMQVDKPAWVRSQLLYFDRISTISPWHVKDVPLSRDEIELQGALVLTRRAPNLMKESVEKASRLMATLIVASKRGMLGSHFTESSIYAGPSRDALNMLTQLNRDQGGRAFRNSIPRVDILAQELNQILSADYVRMHPEKLDPALWNYIRTRSGSETSEESSTDWIDVDPVFGSVYMTILAREMSSAIGASGVTDEPVHDAIFQDVMATDVLSPSHRIRRAEGVVVDLVIESVKLAPDISIPKIIKFRERYPDELTRFRTVVNQAASRCAMVGKLEDVKNEARLILEREINPAVSDLEKALSGYGITWTRSGVLKASSLLFGLAGGIATFDFTGNQYLALSASVGLGLMGFGLSGAGDRQAARESSPYTYLLDLKREFGHAAVM